MRKIGVVTYCMWTSIGSILQSLGLKKALLSQGYNSIIISNKLYNRYRITKVTSLRSFVRWLYDICIYRKKHAAYEKRIRFMNENLSMCNYNSEESIMRELQDLMINGYMAGSDQIWNPSLCNPTFFLDFVPKDKPKLSYAASMGSTNIPAENKEKFIDLINNFDVVSVREDECAQLISELTHRKPLVHIDPTFLVEQEEWRKYEKKYKIDKPYILLYMIYWDNSYRKSIEELKKKTGLTVISISSGLSNVYADKHLFDVGVEEFLWLIDHAKYVITSSFHGVALSTIFNKQFTAVINPRSPSRIQNVIEKLRIPQVSIEELSEAEPYDYSVVNELIKEERNKSFQYLKKVLD